MNRVLALLLLLGGLAAAAPAQRPAAERRASKGEQARPITGRVLSEGGQPVAEASVLLVPAGSMSSRNQLLLLKSRSAGTDEQGRFKFDSVERGAYTVVAYAPGYVVASGTADDDGKDRYFRPGDSITIRLTKGAVITGTVTGPAGEPLIGVRVRATPARGPDGRALKVTGFNQVKDWKTDDRGVYRIYGLEPGTYVVAAGGRGVIPFWMGAYDNDAPTYFPSATRDTAREVAVQSGGEATGIDIRYRDNVGHTISGTVSGPAGQIIPGFAVTLNHAATGASVGWTMTMTPGGNGAFSFDGVPDGEYELAAVSDSESDHVVASPARRVTVRGSDVTGVELVASPLGSIGGRVTLEPATAAPPRPACEQKRPASIGETVLAIRSDERGKAGSSPFAKLPFNLFTMNSDSAVDDKGEFLIRPLDGGRYRIAAQLPTADWFVRSVTLPAAGAAGQAKDAARDGIPVKAGEQVTGVVITLADDAAGLRGRVVASKEGAQLPQRMRVHLVPAEREHSDAVLRYAESGTQPDGGFSFSNLAPGKYWVIARPVSDDADEGEIRPAAWDAAGRADLRREGEAGSAVIELQPCQRVLDHVLKYAPAAKTK
jgi:protocatechuate 3,4-dioxygenase beta subunit